VVPLWKCPVPGLGTGIRLHYVAEFLLDSTDLRWVIRPALTGHAPQLHPMSAEHLEDLRAQSRYARERYQLYKAKAYGQRPTSPARMRELQRAYEQAEARLRAAEAQEPVAPPLGDGPQRPS
jgi:hypothetical protein